MLQLDSIPGSAGTLLELCGTAVGAAVVRVAESRGLPVDRKDRAEPYRSSNGAKSGKVERTAYADTGSERM